MKPSEGTSIKPFLKWPGGKRWLAPTIAQMIRPHLKGAYHEPFLGGGAVFFELQPKNAVLSDINSDVVNVYVQVRSNSANLIRQLKQLPVNADVYRSVRESQTRSAVTRAVHMLYLNRTAWGGLYRVNSAGLFNVPFGGGERTPRPLWENDILSRAAGCLQCTRIMRSDFEPIIDGVGRGDVVYCDPTYTVAHDRNGFIRYNEKNFSWADQVRLAAACSRAAKRGAFVIVSNAHHESVRKLYSRAKVLTYRRKSLVSADSTSRGNVAEYVFVMGPK